MLQGVLRPDPARYFANYTKRPARLPRVLWPVLRWAVLLGTLALALVLAWWPATGLLLWWGLAVPALPLVLVVAPGLWRQVCPMALLNQLPRTHGFGATRDLPPALKRVAYAVAVGLFVGCVALRAPLLNADGALVAAGILGALLLALLGGVAFKGRSGWCGTFCPLGPIQRDYGQAPLLVVRNGFCPTCVGCQKNCYDFNPRGAIFEDLADADPRYGGQRRLFMGLLPGLILAYFLLGPAPPADLAHYLAVLAGACCASAGLYALATVYLPISPQRLGAIFAAAALAAFYWFSGPRIVATLAALLAGPMPAWAAPAWAVPAARAAGLVGGAALILSSLYSSRVYRAAAAGAGAPARAASAAARGPALAGGAAITDRETGVAFPIRPGTTLLEAIEGAGLKINFGCRAGLCGADPVLVCEGATNLSPPGDDETTTLRRMGLEGRARLACMCQVSGPVVIDRDPKSAGRDDAQMRPSVPTTDLAAARGIRRVVIVGNGVAGTSAAEGLRRLSASVQIELVTDEPLHFYNRMAVGRLIYGRTGMDGMQLMPEDWFDANRVAVSRNSVAMAIDRAAKTVLLATGERLPYDRLILATGARAMLPDPAFLDYPNAFVLRSAEDAQAVRRHVQLTRARRAVVIGGGVLGVEAADALHHLGLEVIVLQRAERLMNAQLDEAGSARLAAFLQGIGIQVVTGARIARFEGDAAGLRMAWLAHGPRVRADVFVACLGVQSNVQLAVAAGLEVGRGIRVNPLMETSDPDIYAIGDAAELPGSMSGLWPVGVAQAATAVATMLGEQAPYSDPRMVLQLKCDGIDLRSFGQVEPRPGDDVYVANSGDPAWWRLVVRRGVLVGAVYVGPPQTAGPFTRAVQRGADLAPVRLGLLQGDLSVLASL